MKKREEEFHKGLKGSDKENSMPPQKKRKAERGDYLWGKEKERG